MAPRLARLPHPKPTTINPKDSRYERGTTGGQVSVNVKTILAGADGYLVLLISVVVAPVMSSATAPISMARPLGRALARRYMGLALRFLVRLTLVMTTLSFGFFQYKCNAGAGRQTRPGAPQAR